MKDWHRLLLILLVACHSSASSAVRAADCNDNGIADTVELAECPPIDVVFLIDTSGSTNTDVEALCADVTAAINELSADSEVTVNPEVLAMAVGGQECTCCEGSVPTVYGTAAPGLPEVLGTCGGCNEGDCEDWAPATPIVAANKTWGSGPRIIVPISDEGPRCGTPVNDPGDDRDAIEHAISVVSVNRVVVFTVVIPSDVGDVVTEQVTQLAQDLAGGGEPGGMVFGSVDPNLAAAIADAVRSTCPKDCNGNGAIDFCDIDEGISADCAALKTDCCVPHETASCEDQGVSDCVCIQFGVETCCSASWDQSCVDAGTNSCGASCEAIPDRVPDECQPSPDCDGDGIRETCELSCGPPTGQCDVPGCGTAIDCNANCLPDDCDLVDCEPDDPTCDDCNLNGVPDECDIESGTSCDVDLNLVPDECFACCDGSTCTNLPTAACTGTPYAGVTCAECTCASLGCCIESDYSLIVDCQCEIDGGHVVPPAPFGFHPCEEGACCSETTCDDDVSGQPMTEEDCSHTFIGGADCSGVQCTIRKPVACGGSSECPGRN